MHVSDYTERDEVQDSIASYIAGKVKEIRRLRGEIETIKESSGIAEREGLIEAHRAELLPAAKNYREYTGKSWEDDEGFARPLSEGTSHKYRVETVDQVAAALRVICDELNTLADDREFLFTYESAAGVKLVKKDALYDPKDKPESADALAAALDQIVEARAEMIREFNIRLEGMRQMLDKLAAARSTTTTPERLNVK